MMVLKKSGLVILLVIVFTGSIKAALETAGNYYQRGDREKALEIYQRIERQEDTAYLPTASWNQAVIFFEQKEYRKAAEKWGAYQKCLGDPSQDSYWKAEYYQGKSYSQAFNQKPLEDRIFLLEKAIMHYQNFLASAVPMANSQLEIKFSHAQNDLHHMGHKLEKYIRPAEERREEHDVFIRSLQHVVSHCQNLTEKDVKKREWNEIEETLQTALHIGRDSSIFQQPHSSEFFKEPLERSKVIAHLEEILDHIYNCKKESPHPSLEALEKVSHSTQNLLRELSGREEALPPFPARQITESTAPSPAEFDKSKAFQLLEEKRKEMERYFKEKGMEQQERSYKEYEYTPRKKDLYEEGIKDW